MKGPPTELETERLRLRQWQASDHLPFAQLNADPEVMRYFPAPLTEEASTAMAERAAALIVKRGWGFWAVETKHRRAFIGMVGLHIPSAELPFSPCVEIGWRLARDYWGCGYATEAARASLRFAFETLHLPEVVSFTTVTNTPSRAVMERLGMKPDAATFEHPSVPIGNALREHCLYRITQAEWSAAK